MSKAITAFKLAETRGKPAREPDSFILALIREAIKAPSGNKKASALTEAIER